MKILALDISSTHIGLCYDEREFETIALSSDIAARCAAARQIVHGWIQVWHEDIDLVVIESPVARYAKALIPQARVSGALLGLISSMGIAWIEVSPARAKQVLCGKGNATKQAMIAAAARATGRLLDEHQADAYGLWLAAGRVKVERVAA